MGGRMRVSGDYAANGYAHVEGLVPPEVAEAFLRQIRADLPDLTRQFITNAPIIKRTSIDVYARDYPPMLQFLWGLTPAICELAGRDVLPTYNYFRLYRKTDICRTHTDREACEHSLSLTLGYSDGLVWPFDVGRDYTDVSGVIEDGFGGAPYASISMQPGDAVIYRGVNRRHGRVTPNPNRWSAHLFLHYVDRDGPHASHAFDALEAPSAGAIQKIDFNI
jgi:hypothetical protein